MDDNRFKGFSETEMAVLIVALRNCPPAIGGGELQRCLSEETAKSLLIEAMRRMHHREPRPVPTNPATPGFGGGNDG